MRSLFRQHGIKCVAPLIALAALIAAGCGGGDNSPKEYTLAG